MWIVLSWMYKIKNMKSTFTQSLSILALSALVFTSASCKKDGWPSCIRANGKTTTETRTVSDFLSLEIDIPSDVFLKQDSSISAPIVTIEASENIMDRIETDNKGMSLVIHNKKCISNMKSVKIYVTVADLESVSVSGSANVSTLNAFKVNRMNLDISGSGNMVIEAVTTEMEAHSSGSGNFTLKGATDLLDIDLSGSGTVAAFDLYSQDTYCKISGSGDCDVNVSGILDVDISGSGSVNYRGEPTSVNIQSSGSGTVTKK